MQERYEKDLYRAMGGNPKPEQPSRHQDATLATLLRQPVEAPISRAALDALVRTQTNAVPVQVLEEARAAQLIEQHNAEIDKRKAKKRQLQQIARESGMSTAALKRVLGRG
jgi:hypothetical protein